MDVKNTTGDTSNPTSTGNSFEILGECTVKVRREWQHELHRIIGRDKVHTEVLKILRGCADIRFTESIEEDCIVTVIQGSLRAVNTAATELECLVDKLKGYASPKPASAAGVVVALSMNKKAIDQSVPHHSNTSSGQTGESSLASDDFTAHARDGRGSETPIKPTRKTKRFQTNVSYHLGVYLKETYDTSSSSGIKFTMIPGASDGEHILEVTATCKTQLDEAVDKISQLCNDLLYKQNILSWPVWLNADFNSTQYKNDLLKHGVVLHRMASDTNGTTPPSPQGKSKYCVIGPQQKMSCALPFIIDMIVRVLPPVSINSSVIQSNATKSPGSRFLDVFRSDKNTHCDFKTSCGLEIYICQGDLTREQVEAIVSPNNVWLALGGGASKCIAVAAGNKLIEECRKYIEQHGTLTVSKPMHTTAGNLKAPIKHVLHVAGPVFKTASFDFEQLSLQLMETFFNCFVYANGLGIKSLAIPAISSGNFGIPKDIVASRAFEALMRFNDQCLQASTRRLEKIRFVNIDVETTNVMSNVFRCLVESTDITIASTSVFSLVHTDSKSVTPVVPNESVSTQSSRCLSRGTSNDEGVSRDPSKGKSVGVEHGGNTLDTRVDRPPLSGGDGVRSANSDHPMTEQQFTSNYSWSAQLQNSSSGTHAGMYLGVDGFKQKTELDSAEKQEDCDSRKKAALRTDSSNLVSSPSTVGPHAHFGVSGVSGTPASEHLKHQLDTTSVTSGQPMSETTDSTNSEPLNKATTSVKGKAGDVIGKDSAATLSSNSNDSIEGLPSELSGIPVIAKDVKCINFDQLGNESLYRCVAVYGNSDLQLVERSYGYGHGYDRKRPEDPKLNKLETDLTKDIRSHVISLLESRQVQLQWLNVQLNHNLRSLRCDNNKTTMERIQAIRRGLGKTDPLELLAIAYLMKTQLHLYRLESSTYKLYAKYPPHAYTSRPPILLHVNQTFNLILLNNNKRPSSATSASWIFEEFAQTASDEDKKISFEQLIHHSVMLSNNTPSSEQRLLSTATNAQQQQQQHTGVSRGASDDVLIGNGVHVVDVYKDGIACFYRCVAIHGSEDLQRAQRDSTGYLLNMDLQLSEDRLAGTIKKEVLSFLQSSYDRGLLKKIEQQLEVHLNYSLCHLTCSGYSSLQPLQQRIISLEQSYQTDPLELLAVAYLTKSPVHLYLSDGARYKLYAKYPLHAYSSRPPFLLCKTSDNYFKVLLAGNCQGQWSVDSQRGMFDDYVQTADDEDRKITFEQLIDPSLKLPATPLISPSATADVSQQLLAQDQNKADKYIEDSAAKPPVGSDDMVDESSYDIINLADVEGPSASLPTTTAACSAPDSEDCVICMDKIDPSRRTRLDCGHVFCTDCITECFKKCQPRCPSCSKVFGVLRGNQPEGKFTSQEVAMSLPGYEQFRTIQINYSFPNGVQTENHPNPGQPYKGTHRVAYLPASPEGNEVCLLLKRAFDAGLVFTIDRSVTTGRENCVVWNNIHHKTSIHGSYGYPDPTYLARVKDELAAKGIVPDTAAKTDLH